jgi:hypothetical protein
MLGRYTVHPCPATGKSKIFHFFASQYISAEIKLAGQVS